MRATYIYGSLILGALALVTILVVTFVVRNKSVSYPVVQTPLGSIKGVTVTNEISDFNVFYSIPYAKPPIGDWRFKAPVPVDPWYPSTYDATVESPACVQSGSTEPSSEDCLTLTVAAPARGRASPVLVYLHEGALETGSAKLRTRGPHYYMQYDVIVVIVQYRLDILGFLNLGSEDAPGNMGLADAIAALRWVQENISSFGGDRGRVTVGGLSSGGIMAQALLLSPHAAALFHQVFIQSGTALSYRFYTNDTTRSIQKTKEYLNMTNSSDQQLLARLKNMSTMDLLSINQNIKNQYPRGYHQYYTFPLTRDYAGILPKDPLQLLKENEYTHVPMLMGYTAEEGNRLEAFEDRLDFVNDNFMMVVPSDLYPLDDHSPEKAEAAHKIKQFYFGNEELSLDTFENYANMCTDSWYAHITDYSIRLQASQNYSAPIYYYMFAVDGTYNWAKLKNGYRRPGAIHTDDEAYMWKIDYFDNVVSNDNFSDIARERYVNMFYNFIASGDPTPQINSLIPIKWEPVNYPQVKYLLINRTLTMSEDPFRDRLLFWQRMYGLDEL